MTATAAEALARTFVDRLNDIILFPLIALMAAIALLYFLYGAFMYIAKADNETEQTTGKQHMLYGIIGLVIMFSAFAILQIAAGTFDLGDELDCADQGVGC